MGYDINETLINAAKTTYSKHSDCFKVVDILNDEVNQTFDYVVLSGLFNSNYGQDFQWVCTFIEKMYALSNKKVIFNAISTYTNSKEETMYYIDPLQISDFIIRPNDSPCCAFLISSHVYPKIFIYQSHSSGVIEAQVEHRSGIN